MSRDRCLEESRPLLDDSARAVFEEDGVVVVRGAVGDDWVQRILEDADRQLSRPGRWVTDTSPAATTNRLFTSRYRWQQEPVVRDFVFNSPVAAMAAELLQSRTVRLYFDHLLVKEPRTAAPTPWHQDIPYWPFMGRQIVSAWVSATASTVEESALEFVRGSHRWNSYYAPESFDGRGGWTDDFAGERMPDIEAARRGGDCPYEIVSFDVAPGDAVFFSAWIIHGARGNAGDRRRVALSTRWLGDDAVWHPHPGCDPIVTDADTTDEPGERLADDVRFPVVIHRSSRG